jgi:hypothetical protein
VAVIETPKTPKSPTPHLQHPSPSPLPPSLPPTTAKTPLIFSNKRVDWCCALVTVTKGSFSPQTHWCLPLLLTLTPPPPHFCHLCNAVPLPCLDIIEPPLPMFAAFAMLYSYPVWKLLRGDVPERGPLRSGSYCGTALHRRYLMAPASAQLRVRPARKDGGHPALCNAPPQ